MPKNKTAIKKKGARSSYPSNFLSKRFSLKSNKAKFITTIMIVGVVGAGYFTIKSFAATTVSSWTAAQLTAVCTGYNSGTPKGTLVPVSSKNALEFVSLPPRGCTQGTYVAVSTTPDSYRVCVSVSGTGAITLGGPYGLPMNINTGGNFNTVCTSYAYVASNSLINPQVFNLSTTQTVQIATVWQERMGAPTGGASTK